MKTIRKVGLTPGGRPYLIERTLDESQLIVQTVTVWTGSAAYVVKERAPGRYRFKKLLRPAREFLSGGRTGPLEVNFIVRGPTVPRADRGGAWVWRKLASEKWREIRRDYRRRPGEVASEK